MPTTTNTLPLSGAHLAMQQLLSINVHLSAAHHQHVTSETIITLKLTLCFQWFSVVSKENRLQTKIRCTIIADIVLQIGTNSLVFSVSYVYVSELSYHHNLDDPWNTSHYAAQYQIADNHLICYKSVVHNRSLLSRC